MGKNRGRLDPSEVKQALQKPPPPDPQPAFNNPFAAARELLERVPVKEAPKKKQRAPRPAAPAGEPSLLARLRAQKKAEREALSAAVQPVRRPGRGTTTPAPPSVSGPRKAPDPARPGEERPIEDDAPLGPPPPRLL